MITNHAVNALLERRSIRSYRAEQISEEELSDILAAAKYAPSSMGYQARHMTVIQNKKLLADIVTATNTIFRNNGRAVEQGHDPFYKAPTVIVVSAPKDSNHGQEDAACAIMNLMIAAHAYGLGTCYIASAVGIQEPEIVAKLGLPENYAPVACVTVGYPSEHPAAPIPRREDDVNYIM